MLSQLTDHVNKISQLITELNSWVNIFGFRTFVPVKIPQFTEALLKMVAPGAGFRGDTLFRTKIKWRPKKKGLRCKISGFLVQKYVKTKKKVFA